MLISLFIKMIGLQKCWREMYGRHDTIFFFFLSLKHHYKMIFFLKYFFKDGEYERDNTNILSLDTSQIG